MMLFKSELIGQIVARRKTQTRRPVKPGETFDAELQGVRTANGKSKICIGKTYAVQPGRGKPGVWWHEFDGKWRVAPTEVEQQHLPFMTLWKPLRIRINGIRMENVRRISLEDARAEGFEDELGFWKVWCGFYDHCGVDFLDVTSSAAAGFVVLEERPDDLYQAWAYDFEVVR